VGSASLIGSECSSRDLDDSLEAIREAETKRLRHSDGGGSSFGAEAIAANSIIPRRIALHEAGHAIAFCYYGCGFDHVTVYSKARARKTGEQACCSASGTFSYYLSRSDMTADDRQALRKEGFSDIVISLAGCAAERRHRKKSIAAAIADYGQNDYEKALAVAEFIAKDDEDQDSLIKFSLKEAQRFVRMPVIWEAINSLADLIQKRGRITKGSRDVKSVVAPVLRLRNQISASPNWRERSPQPTAAPSRAGILTSS